MNLRPFDKGKVAVLGLAGLASGLLGKVKFFGKSLNLSGREFPAPPSPEEIGKLRAALRARMFQRVARPNRATRRRLEHRARRHEMQTTSRRINAGLL